MSDEPTASTPSGVALWIVLPIGVLMLAFIVLLATRDTNESGLTIVDLDGELAPRIVGTTIDGDEFDLDDLRGQFVVVNFFQTTCVPCIQEHPELISFHEAYAASGTATVVSVAFDDQPDNIREFFEEFGGAWPVIAEDTGPVAVDYGVALVPESAIVAPTGEVIEKLIGGVTRAQIEQVIAEWQAGDP
ncbi:MAG: redoxin family protein [Acidimicrobiales bacterium]|nr:redoxin family protein [Acidimicrobiales bacterium]